MNEAVIVAGVRTASAKRREARCAPPGPMNGRRFETCYVAFQNCHRKLLTM